MAKTEGLGLADVGEQESIVFPAAAVAAYALWLHSLSSFSLPRLELLGTDVPTRFVTWVITIAVIVAADRLFKRQISPKALLCIGIIASITQPLLVSAQDFATRTFVNAIAGVSLGALCMGICRVGALFKPHKIACIVTMGVVAGAVAYVVITPWLTSNGICLLSAVLPAASAVLLMRSKPSRQEEPWKPCRLATFRNENIPWSLFITVCVIFWVSCCLYSFSHLPEANSNPQIMQSIVSIRVLAGSVILWGTWFFTCKLAGKSFVSMLIPLAVCMFVGFDLFAYLPSDNPVGYVLFVGSCEALRFYWIIFLCGISYRYHLPVIPTCGIGMLVCHEVFPQTIGYIIGANVPGAVSMMESIAFLVSMLFMVVLVVIENNRAKKMRRQRDALVAASAHNTKSLSELIKDVVSEQGLTERESEIVVMSVQGRTIAYIAEALTLSPNTVKSYLRNAENKLGVSDKQELISNVVDKIDAVLVQA